MFPLHVTSSCPDRVFQSVGGAVSASSMLSAGYTYLEKHIFQ